MNPFKRVRFNLDALGVCASSACMVHCLAFPFLLAALPLMDLAGPSPEAANAVQATDSQLPPCCADQACHEQDGATTQTAEADAGGACCATPVDFWVHVGLLATVAPLGVVAWGAGFRRHGRPEVVGLGLMGVLLLAGALLFGTQMFGGRGEQMLTVLGSVCMVSAHLWNRRQCRCCRPLELDQLVQVDGLTLQPASTDRLAADLESVLAIRGERS